MKTNEELQRDVMAEIQWDPELKEVAPEIGVSAKDGVITLSGIVRTYSKKIAAERAAQRVKGVKVVAVDIEVAVPNSPATSDAQLASTIRNALMWNSNVDDDKIEVKVDNGWIYLDGLVDWKFEKGVAETMIEGLAGIRGITNNIRIRPRQIDEHDIRKKIAAAFHRNATLDSKAISVQVSGAKVILKGTVQSWAEKEEAARIAWSSPGVFEVNNQIDVESEIMI